MVQDKQVAFRFSADMVKRLEAYVDRMGEAMPGVRFTLADAVRALLTKALDAEEASGKKKGAKP